MNQQTHEEICVVPIIPRMFFPYVVKVIASDTRFPVAFEAKGLLYENGAVEIEYPFKDQDGNCPKIGDDGTAIDIEAIILPNGQRMAAEHWGEVAEAPPHNRSLLASLSRLCDA